MRRSRAKTTYGNSGSSGRTAHSRNKDQHSYDSSWERFLRIANYEINDPYRGITNCSDDSPWKICCEASPQHEFDNVTLVCRSSCPSLRAWTAKSDLFRKREERKRKKGTSQQQMTLGRRREGFSCSCDSNPVSVVVSMWILLLSKNNSSNDDTPFSFACCPLAGPWTTFSTKLPKKCFLWSVVTNQ